MQDGFIEKLFEVPSKDFVEHLAITGNERIIFSGRFGMGKTTFLKDYFFTDQTKNEKGGRSKDYNVIHIFPVNYSIAQNQDIFRYIKYDILLEMLRQGVSVESIDLQFLDTLPSFIKDNILEIGTSIIKMASLVGKGLSEVGSELIDLYTKFKEYHSEKSSEANSGDQLVKFIGRIESEQGSIYEDDVITNIIEQELDNWCTSGETRKEKLLIIDDIDRIDPEHIFRIMNVFAAHFDRPNKRKLGNKFGFDKIILVCDIGNIRHIFRAKYGQNVDFNGYIDKFYSNHIFEFDSYSEFVDVALDFIGGVPVKDERGATRSLERYNGDLPLTKMLVEWLVFNQEVDLRNIFKLQNSAFKSRVFYVGKSDVLREKFDQLIWCFKVLTLIKGDYLSLIECFSKNYEWDVKWPEKQLIAMAALLFDLQSKATNRDVIGTNHVYVCRSGEELYHLKYLPEHPFRELIKIGINGSTDSIRDPGKLLRMQVIQTIQFLKRERIL